MCVTTTSNIINTIIGVLIGLIAILSVMIFFMRIKKYLDNNAGELEKVLREDKVYMDPYLVETLKSKGYINPGQIVDIIIECKECSTTTITEYNARHMFNCDNCGRTITINLINKNKDE